MKRIVIIGGGTGTSIVLTGLKKYQVSLSAIINTIDNAGSSGTLRDAHDMVPPGDLRQCLAALSRTDAGLLNYRFASGPAKSHPVGNLVIASAYLRHGDIQCAMDELTDLFDARGSIIPATLRPATLTARLSTAVLHGEAAVTMSRDIRSSLKKLSVSFPRGSANPRAAAALRAADAIIVCPGNLYSSVLPVLLIPEIRRAFRASRAKKIYIANLANQPGHTDGFSASDFLDAIQIHTNTGPFTHGVYNTAPLPRIGGDTAEVVRAPKRDVSRIRWYGGRLAATAIRKKERSDPLAARRNPFLHDTRRLARIIMRII